MWALANAARAGKFGSTKGGRIMSKFFEALDDKLIAFIEAQPMFFIASAVADGRVNLSPKGLDSFRVLGPNLCAYLDITGSGAETAAHALAGGRATIMFCSYTRNPLVLRLYGRTRVGPPGGELWNAYADRFQALSGARQIIAFDIESCQTACGFGVPVMKLEKTRTTLTDTWAAKGEKATAAYRAKKNKLSIDGLPTGLVEA
jgi:hypothetical protein